MTTRTWSNEQSDIFHWFSSSRVRFKAGTDGVICQHLVVRARAGTGKTTTILEGVEHAPERTILLAAFNKSIATELQSRVKHPGVEAKTLHALGCKFVFRNWKNAKVDDNGERASALAEAACDGLNAPNNVLRLVRNLHTKAREIHPFAKSGKDLERLATRFDLLPDDEMEDGGWTTDMICGLAFRAMEKAKLPSGLFDFADMIFLPLVNKWLRPWYDMVVVDEAQDMTEAQLALAEGVCKRNGRICVVGDDRQAIYGFRGADSNSLDRLKTKLDAAELTLTTTYRCPLAVVKLAAELVGDYKAAPNAPEGMVRKASRDNMEATAVEGDFILSRSNGPLIKICMALLKRGIRARIKGRDIGRAITALVRKLEAQDLKTLQTKLETWVEHEVERAMKLSEEASKDRCDYIQDVADVIEALIEVCAVPDQELNPRTGMQQLMKMIDDLFTDDAEKKSVMCSTVHRAKGLEAVRVFLLEGTFRRGFEEEDNIRYVGITRSKSELVWVSGFEKPVTSKAA